MAAAKKAPPAPKVERKIKNGWSSSRFQTYALCPAKASYKFIDKLPEPPAPPLDRGSLIHKQAEAYIKGQPCPIVVEGGPYPRLNKDGSYPTDSVPPLEFYEAGVMPPQLKKFELAFKAAATNFKLKSKLKVVEDNWGFTKDWIPCSSTDWTNCWLRVKVDYAFAAGPMGDVLYIYDWKTGKFDAQLQAEYLEALELYALTAMIKFPHIKKVIPALIYLDSGARYPLAVDKEISYKRADIPKLKKAWEDRVAPMFADRIFAPKPNQKCFFCPFSKAKGGPCQF